MKLVGFSFDYLPHCLKRRLCLKRRPASQQFIQDCSEAIDIRSRGEVLHLSGGLFRRHVTGRPLHRLRLSETQFSFNNLGQAEVADMRLAFRVQQNIRRLEVPV